MKLKRPIFIGSFLIFLAIPALIFCREPSLNMPKLTVFYSPTCHKCTAVKNELMPDIEKKFKDKILIEYLDVSDIQNYKLMLGLQERYGVKTKNVLPVFYLEGRFLDGDDRLARDLEFLITETINKQFKEKSKIPSIDLVARFKNFRPFTIISAGLIDGINPCAFTVIVFFISFLTLQGYRKKELIIIGLSFVFAVFVTYVLIGIGLFSFLYTLRGFWIAAKIFNFSVGIFSIVLGTLALYDFFRFKKTKKFEETILQLPGSIKNRIHAIIGLHYREPKKFPGEESLRIAMPKLIFSALITGFLVSILEAVCTGQVYLPTISFILKTSSLKLQALHYLLLYNLMFIIPLLVIFIFALLGATSEQFSQILKRHFSTVKILMAGLFFGLGIFLIWKI